MEASRRIELLYTDLQSARFRLILNIFLCNKWAEHIGNVSRKCGSELQMVRQQERPLLGTKHPFTPDF